MSLLELSGTRLSSIILQFYVRERGRLQNKAIVFSLHHTLPDRFIFFVPIFLLLMAGHLEKTLAHYRCFEFAFISYDTEPYRIPGNGRFCHLISGS